MQIRKAVEKKIFPHFLYTIQWILLITILAFDLNFAVGVTGAVASGGLKVIMLFLLWIPFSSAILCLIFYRIREEGLVEKCVIGVSTITFLSSIINVSLHFIDNFLLLMKVTEVVAWWLFNSVFSLSVYKISIVFLLPFLRRLIIIEKQTLGNDTKSGEGRGCKEHR